MSDYADDGGWSGINYNDAGQATTTEDIMAAAMAADDDPGPGLSLGAQISLQLCAIGDKLDRQYQDACAAEQWRLGNLPNVVTLPTQQVILAATAGNPVVLDFGTPTQGRLWDVRSLVAIPAGSDLNGGSGNGAFTATWYVGPLPPGGAVQNSVATQARWSMDFNATASGLPKTDKIGPDQIAVRPGERLFAIVATYGTASLGKVVYLTPTIADQAIKSARPVTLS